MLLQINFNLLLASVLVVLSCTGDAQAAPSKRGAVVSMPIRSIHHVRNTDIHPHIVSLAGFGINILSSNIYVPPFSTFSSTLTAPFAG
jgi:hypothetical protein